LSVEINREQEEDESWLRKDDGNQINVTKLDAVITGINNAVKSSFTSVTVVADSATELIELYDFVVRVRLAKSEDNLADALTCVSRSWFQTQVCAVGSASTYSIFAIRDLHDTNHLGSEKALHLAKCKWGDAVVKEDIARIVREYDVCRQFDSVPVNWESGKRSVETTWTRLASDITHCNGVHF